jgi:HD-like signal output (HDOD) protein
MSRLASIDQSGENDASKQILDQIGRRMLKRRVDALKNLPTFPESILRMNEMMLSDRSSQSFAQIAEAIEVDPVMTARILRMVNSAFYGVSGAIASVYDALVMLGLDVVRGIILSSSAMALAAGRQGIRGLREHSFGAAVAASALGKVIGASRIEEASAAALMHDIGKLVLASQLGREYDQVVARAIRHDQTIYDAEAEMLGVSHDVIGKWLVTRWRLPASLAEPIALHHTPEKSRRYEDTTAIVHVADLMVRGYGFGFAGDMIMPHLSQRAWRTLSLNARKLEKAVKLMHDDLQKAMVQANLYVFE